MLLPLDEIKKIYVPPGVLHFPSFVSVCFKQADFKQNLKKMYNETKRDNNCLFFLLLIHCAFFFIVVVFSIHCNYYLKYNIRLSM